MTTAREQIQQIVNSHNADLIRQELPKVDSRISIIKTLRTSIDCFMFAMMERSIDPKKIKRPQTLNDLQNIKQERKSIEGNLIFYLNGDQIKHVALSITKDLAMSKWGEYFVISHPTLMVPNSYGESILYINYKDFITKRKK